MTHVLGVFVLDFLLPLDGLLNLPPHGVQVTGLHEVVIVRIVLDLELPRILLGASTDTDEPMFGAEYPPIGGSCNFHFVTSNFPNLVSTGSNQCSRLCGHLGHVVTINW